MNNKTILITGSTDGIGKLAALKLAEMGHHIILHGRSPEKLSNVKKEIESLTGNTHISSYVADFSILDEVRSMADRIIEDQLTIDVLVNNAGVFKVVNSIGEDELDVRLVVNYLAPVILTNALLPILQKGKGSRIINLSSAAQDTVSAQFMEKNSNLSDNQAYAQSKLALLMWSFDLAVKYPSLTTIALNPGSLLNTKMAKEAYGKFWSPADKGADIIIDLAINGNSADKSGQYFDNDSGRFSTAHPDAYQNHKIKALITKTYEILEM